MATEVQIRAEQANQILANPVFHDAFEGILNGTVQAIADAPIEDSEMRNQLGLLLAAAQTFKQELFDAIDSARLEESQNDGDPQDWLPPERDRH